MQVLSRALPRPAVAWPPGAQRRRYRPLSYYPLSLWPWQETIKAVFLGRVDVVSTYDKKIHSPSFEMSLPSVVSLKQYVAAGPVAGAFYPVQRVPARQASPASTARSSDELTFDHVTPRSRGGRTTWENIVTACARCNLGKGGRTPREAAMHPRLHPRRPTMYELQDRGRRFPPNHLHESWLDYLYWDIELEA